MKYRELGKTGLMVSEVGFGCWGIGGAHAGHVAYGALSESSAIELLQYSFDQGITFYDTSDYYGYGESERRIGKAFERNREKVIIATKGGLINENEKNFSHKHLIASVESSLKRLNSEYIDLYQLHNCPENIESIYPDILDTIHQLKAEGKVKHFGISVKSPKEGLSLISTLQPETIQFNFNLLDQRARDCGLLTYCEQYSIGAIMRTPLTFGFLTGQYTTDTKFPEFDHRDSINEEKKLHWISRADALKNNAKLSEVPMSVYALKYCLNESQKAIVIPGMQSIEHIRENILASTLNENIVCS